MGIAGVSMIGIIVFLVATIISIKNYLVWSSKGKYFGTVKELKETHANYSNYAKGTVSSTEYVYTVEVTINGRPLLVDCEERVFGEKPTNLKPGRTIPVFVDAPRYKAKYTYDLQENMLLSAGGLVIMIALLLFCCLIFV